MPRFKGPKNKPVLIALIVAGLALLAMQGVIVSPLFVATTVGFAFFATLSAARAVSKR